MGCGIGLPTQRQQQQHSFEQQWGVVTAQEHRGLAVRVSKDRTSAAGVSDSMMLLPPPAPVFTYYTLPTDTYAAAAAAACCCCCVRYDLNMSDHLKPRGPRNAALLSALTALTGNPPIVSLSPSGPDPMGLAVLRAGLASDSELIQAGWRTGSTASDVGLCARVMGRLGVPKSAATEQKVLAVLASAVEACLAVYPSSIQQDQAELEQLQEQVQQQQQGEEVKGADSSSMLQQVRISMLKGLISEKSALIGSREVLASLQQQLARLAAGGAVKAEQLNALYGGED